MSDYINRENAKKWLTNLRDDCGRYQDMWHYAEALDQIIESLDVDVAPIRHGSWKEVFYGEAGGYTFFNVICSCCGYDMGDKMTPFCPNCGTKMDGELIKDERIF